MTKEEDRRSWERLLPGWGTSGDDGVSPEGYRQIFDHSNDAIFLIDPEKDAILDANPRACGMLGYSKDELLVTPVSAIHPNEMPKLQEFAHTVFLRGQGWTNELTCTTKRGEVLPSEISASSFDVSGRHCVVAIVRDVTERRQAEEAQRELVVLEERNRLAREIHDSIAQGLTAIIWQLNVLERSVRSGDEQVLPQLERLRGLARDSLQEARRSVSDLSLGLSGGRALPDALEDETEKIASAGEMQSSFKLSGARRVLPAGVEAGIFRICQEALANVLKHANATSVNVMMAYEDSRVRLTVQDDGMGFDPEQSKPRSGDGGFGLISMKERVRLLGGDLSIQSAPGQGTLVEATLSLNGG